MLLYTAFNSTKYEAILNGIVLLSFINEQCEKGLSVAEAVPKGAELRQRPVLARRHNDRSRPWWSAAQSRRQC